MKYEKWPSRWLLFAYIGINCAYADEKYNAIHRDGSFEFSYDTPDSFHVANGDKNNVVRGEFGGRNPKTGVIDKTTYTAGPRGYRPRGKNIARKYDLSQIGPRPIGSKDDPYYDPYEDPSYNFAFRTRTYSREENANRYGDVKGSYTYVDDVGERHNVEFIAGKQTGFHVKTPFPDSNPNAYGPLFFNGRGKPIPRGRTAIQRGLDGSYRFISAGPDQRRTETSDASGHVRGSYTYLDDKGVQHSVHYIAGPETGYRVLKNVKGPHVPTIYPFSRPDIIPPDYYDSFDKAEKELFDTAASGHPRPAAGSLKPNSGGGGSFDEEENDKDEGVSTSRPQYGTNGRRPSGRPKPPKPPLDEYEDGGEDIDLFGSGGGGTGSTVRPIKPNTGGKNSDNAKPSGEEEEEEKEEGEKGTKPNYKPATTYDDGTYKPSDDEGAYRPSEDGAAERPSRPSGSKQAGTGIPSTRPNDKDFESPVGESKLSGEDAGLSGFSSTTTTPGQFEASEEKENGGTNSTSRPNYDFDGDGTEPTSQPDRFGVSTYRPSKPNIRPRPTRPPFGNRPFGSRPFGVGGANGNRPTSKPATGFNEQNGEEEEDDFNLFGSETSGPVSRPSSTTGRPSEEGETSGSSDRGRPGKRPSSNQRPTERPGVFKPSFEPSSADGEGVSGGDYEEREKPAVIGVSSGSSDRRRPGKRPSFNQRPTQRPGVFKPSFEPSNADGEGVSGGGYEEREKPAVIGVSGGGGEDSIFERGTIVTNLGDKVFSVPPGVSVRAHVQAIDLLPLGSRIPSPSEQYRTETTIQSEASENVSRTTTAAANKTSVYNDEEDIFK